MGDPSSETFGKVLADARAARGMTLQQVSASTKISISKLQAIERDEIENLPGGIFTRGFVRSYAETVGLDPQETLAQFEARFPEESSVATLHATIEGRANEEFVKRQKTAKVLIWSALLAVPLVVWLLVVGAREVRSPAEREPAVAAAGETSGAPASETPPVSETPSVSETPPASDVVPDALRPTGSEVRPDPPPAAASAAGQLTMEISPTADCWVQASADGATVFSRVLRAGEGAVVVAQGAIELRIGDAGAFAFTINQRPGRVLGASGEVLDVRITPANYLTFVAE